jgi:NADH-quinone oxidoreductase subunit N
MNYLQLLQAAAPEAIVVGAALLVLTIALLTEGRSARAGVSVARRPAAAKDDISVGSRPMGACAAVAALGLALAAMAVVRLPSHSALYHGMLVLSPLNSLFKLIVLILAFFTVLLIRGERALPNEGEYLAMVLLATVGLMLLIGSEELLMIFIGLELSGLSLYLLTGFDKTNRASAEAALKYFLFGSTASAFTLFGLSLLYGMGGTTSLGELTVALGVRALPPLFLLGVVMTLVGFAFKIAAAPFHLWAPDAYQGGPVPGAAFIASASKVAAFVVLGKIVLLGLGSHPGSAAWAGLVAGWKPILAVLAALSILLGNLAALAQKNVRRLLAYSAVAHAGYTLLGLIASGREGFSATLFYTTIYAVTLLGAFGVVAVVRQKTGGDDLADFAGLRRHSPLYAACMAIFMLSLAGLPPLAGFAGKFYLFLAAVRGTADQGLLWLVVLALFGSLISLYYYLIVLKEIFLGKERTHSHQVDFSPPATVSRSAVVALAAIVLLAGILPSIILDPILAALR